MIETRFHEKGLYEIPSLGPWPTQAWDDIINITIKLNEIGMTHPHLTLIGPKHILNSLDAQIENTTSTIATALVENNLLNEIVRLDKDDPFAIILAQDTDFSKFPEIICLTTIVKITGLNSLRD